MIFGQLGSTIIWPQPQRFDIHPPAASTLKAFDLPAAYAYSWPPSGRFYTEILTTGLPPDPILAPPTGRIYAMYLDLPFRHQT